MKLRKFSSKQNHLSAVWTTEDGNLRVVRYPFIVDGETKAAWRVWSSNSEQHALLHLCGIPQVAFPTRREAIAAAGLVLQAAAA